MQVGHEDHEPPMGDLGVRPNLARTESHWTSPTPHETNAPHRRIVHHRVWMFHALTCIGTYQFNPARGYHTCGSRLSFDYIQAVDVWVCDRQGWHLWAEHRNLPADPPPFDAPSEPLLGLRFEVRRSFVDGWWPSWNLVHQGIAIAADIVLAPRDERLLDCATPTVDGTHVVTRGPVRMAFACSRPSIASLQIRCRVHNQWSQNLLRTTPGGSYQGPRVQRIGAAADAADFLRMAVEGTATPHEHGICYDISLPAVGLHYHYRFDLDADGALHTTIQRRVAASVELVELVDWQWGFDPRVSIVTLAGDPIREGRTGGLVLPATLDFPPFARALCIGTPGTTAEVIVERPIDLIRLGFQLGDDKTSPMASDPDGANLPSPMSRSRTDAHTTMLAAGYAEGRWTWVWTDEPNVVQDAPSERNQQLHQTVFRTLPTGLSYRADTATYTNNGASMHCPMSLDMWSALAIRSIRFAPELKAMDRLRDSLERWLYRAPGYTAGPVIDASGRHLNAEDEYLMTGAAAIRALADLLLFAPDPAWESVMAPTISQALADLRARDVDGDGLIESPYRTGTSGSGQWSTCWFDVTSFGWKCAFSNAILYDALQRLRTIPPDGGIRSMFIDVEALGTWTDLIKKHYERTFWNPATNWLGGWRCINGQLHDYGFLFVNGAAIRAGLIDADRGRGMLKRLYDALMEILAKPNVPTARLGLPGNVIPIPDADRADIMQGYPYGFYQNGGRTHAQTRHFVGALRAAGLETEALTLLDALADGLNRAVVYAGCKSGVDWRMHDGRPCGYEGLLTDQFGILEIMMDVLDGERIRDDSARAMRPSFGVT